MTVLNRVLVAALVLASATATAVVSAPAASADPAVAGVTPNPAHVKVLTAALAKITAAYQAGDDFFPADILDYQIGTLWKEGLDGTGTSVAVLEGWNDPNITSVVDRYDTRYGLPAPDIQTIYPSGDGKLPATCPPGMVVLGSYGSCDAWAGELELDVLAVHLVAPYAKIIIAATPADSEITDDAASNVAPPEMMQAIEYLSSHHLADAISISDGTGEATYSHGAPQIHAQDVGLLSAAAAGIPVMVATGDCGVVQNLAIASSQCGNVSSGPATATWDDSPWTVAVGGSQPNLNKDGSKAGPDPVWRDGVFSPGAGLSAIYPRPSYQDGVARVTHSDMRAVPDITMDARDGTSQAAPLFAGVMALAAQLNHGPVGPINQALYQALGPRGAAAGIQDVVSGNNSVFNKDGSVKVQGYTAGPGYDLVSGWGTVNAATFVPALVRAQRTQPWLDAGRLQAGFDLARLRHNITLRPAAGGDTALTATGYLPTHPVTVSVDGTQVATVTAADDGTVGYSIDPATLGLTPGFHQVTLHSMLLTSSAAFIG